MNRILSVLLSFMVVFCAIPAVSSPAYAATTTVSNFTQLRNAITSFNNSASADTTIAISADFAIEPVTPVIQNGYLIGQSQKITNKSRTLTITSANPASPRTLTRGFDLPALFTVEQNAKLIMKDIIIDGLKDSMYADSDSSLIYVTGGSFTMESGTVLKNNTISYGGAVSVDRNGTFTMNGGEIKDCIAYGNGDDPSFECLSEGAGVYVDGFGQSSGSKFIMNGGTISNNYSRDFGGGVYIWGGSFTMNGGEIIGNTADFGGGVYLVEVVGEVNKATVKYPASFTMNGGKISGNIATVAGGGVYSWDSSFTMNSGAVIEDNEAAEDGAGVYMVTYHASPSMTPTTASFTFNGGEIRGNSALADGGGIYIIESKVTMKSGAYIKNNTAASGGGVFLSGSSVITPASFGMSGGEISGNAAAVGGGVNVSAGTSVNPIILGGAAVIKENTPGAAGALSNVRLDAGRFVTLGTGAAGNGVAVPTTGMNVGANAASGNIIVNSGATAVMAGYFQADDSDLKVSFNGGRLIMIDALEEFKQQVASYGSATADMTILVPKDLILDGNISIPSNSNNKTLTIKSDGAVPFMLSRSTADTSAANALFTVGPGAGLTLENIILDGRKGAHGTNQAPLVRVDGTGVFSVGNGAVLKDNRGGGVYVNTTSTGTFRVGGNSVVSGNTDISDAAYNVYIASGRTIQLGTGSSGNGLIAPASGMNIGITPAAAGAFTSGSGANSTVAGYFIADQSGKMIALRSSQLHFLTNINSLTLTPPAALTYSGSAQSPAIAMGGLVRDTDFTLSGSATDVGSYSATLTGIGLYGGTRTVGYTIVPNQFLGTNPSISQSMRIGVEDEVYNITLTQLLSVLSGMSGSPGAVSYTAGIQSDEKGVIKGTSITGNTLTVTTDTAATGAEAGDVATISIGISTHNFGNYSALLTLMVMDKIDVSDSIIFAAGSDTYTGSELSHENAAIPGIAASGAAGWTYAYDLDAQSDESLGSSGRPVNAGSYTVVATYEDPQYIGSKTVGFTVNKAIPGAIVWPEASGITYGEPLSASMLTGGSTNGVFARADDTIVPVAGIQSYNVTFTPNDTYNYNWSGISLTNLIATEVAKASGMTATPPTGIMILRSKTAANSFDLDSILLDKADAGIRSYALNGVLSGEAGVLNGQPALGGDRNKTLTYPGSGRTEGTAVQSVTIESGNYESVNVDITFTTPPITDVSHLMTFNDGNAIYTGSALAHENASLDTSGFSPAGPQSMTYTYTPDSANAMLNAAGKPLNAGTYTVDALYEDTDNIATGRATLTVIKADQTAPPAPTLAARTKTSITLADITAAGAAVEYRRDALPEEWILDWEKEDIEEWQTDTSFADLEANTGYTFYTRLQGDGNRNDSLESAASGIFVTAKTNISSLIITDGIEPEPVRALSVYRGATIPLTANHAPSAEECLGVTWTTSNDRIVSLVSGESLNGMVANITAETTGTATITVRLDEDDVIYDVCHVTVISPPPDNSINIISDSERPIKNGRIQDALYSEGLGSPKKTLQLQTTGVVKAAWKSSDTTVATINAAGLITYKNTGTTTITATGKSSEDGKNLSGAVILTIIDTAPKLPVNKVSINSHSSAGALFAILPSDTFKFNDVYNNVYIKSATLKNKPVDDEKFELSQVNSETYRLIATPDLANKPANGTYVLALQAIDSAGKDAGFPFNLTVVVTNAIPKPAVKIPALNVFYSNISSKAPITGAGLPQIDRVELKPTGNIKDGNVTENFTAEYIDGMVVFSAKPVFNANGTGLNSAKKTAVKGILEVYYKDFSDKFFPLPVTIPIKDAAPKLTLAPASQTININYGSEVTFGVNGGTLDRVLKVAVAANNVINDPVLNEAKNAFTVRFNESAKASATNNLQVSVWLENARRAVVLKPKVVTTTKAPTYKLSVKTVTLNNTLIDQVTTVAIVPNISNAPFEVVSTGDWRWGVEVDRNWALDEDGDPAEDMFGDSYLVKGKELRVTVAQDLTFTGNNIFNIIIDTPQGEKTLPLNVKAERKALAATVKAGKEKIELVNRAHETSKVVYTPTIKNNAREITNVRFANPADNDKFTVKLSQDKKAVVTANEDFAFRRGATHKVMLQFCIGENNDSEEVWLTTKTINVKPNHSAVALTLPKSTLMYQSRAGIDNAVTIPLTVKKPIGATIDKLVIKANPGAAYWYYFDRSEQELHIWIVDGALAKPGKATLTFEATYAGHGVEANGNPKPALLKIPVNILR